MWQKGPEFLTRPFDEWPVKSVHEIRKKPFDSPAELREEESVETFSVSSWVSFSRVSKWEVLVGAMPRVLVCMRRKKFGFWLLDVKVKEDARLIVLKEAQKWLVQPEVRFKNLGVISTAEGLWAVGARGQGDLQVIIPRDHPVSTLLMNKAHIDAGHTGRDSTLATFRVQYHTSQSSKLAKKVRGRCTLCRLIDKKTHG